MTAGTIIVTGASRGIGRSTVYQAIQHFQCNVIGVARSQDHLESLAKDEGLKDRFKYVVGDVADEKVFRQAVELAKSSWSGELHGLVLNAAVLEPIAAIAESSDADWKRLFDINFFSLVTAARIALPALRETKGRIIIVGSNASRVAIKGWGAYCTSKCATNMLAEILAIEEKDVVSVLVDPGVVDTAMQGVIREQGAESMGEFHNEFMILHQQGLLKHADAPAYILANMALNAKPDISGKYVPYDDPAIVSQYGKK
ncbi:hypothetical protein DFQ26_005199 [Actinomortierella ambigua]|nr:hypothetical protein DFQ26_005199 [Actinomortierella ambigua]